MKRRIRTWACLMAAVGQALAAAPAGAQMDTFGLNLAEPKLTQSDFQMLWDSASNLNEAPSPQPGDSRSWKNPQSGNFGQVALERVFQSDNMPCHALRYTFTIAADPQPRVYDINWCRTSDGAWKILN